MKKVIERLASFRHSSLVSFVAFCSQLSKPLGIKGFSPLQVRGHGGLLRLSPRNPDMQLSNDRKVRYA